MNKKRVFILFPSILLIVLWIIFLMPVSYLKKVLFFDVDYIKIPPELKKIKVLKGEKKFKKEILFQDPSLDGITNIFVKKFKKEQNLEIFIVDAKGALILDRNFNIKSTIIFTIEGEHIETIDINYDEDFEFFERGGSSTQKSSLRDSSGNILWEYSYCSGGGCFYKLYKFFSRINWMSAGDINDDGKIEFAVGFSGGGGVHLLNENGKKIWEKPDANVWHVEFADTNGDGKLEIVHSNARGHIIVRNKKGEILTNSDPLPYFSYFSIIRWPIGKNKECLLISEDDTIWILDFNGKVVKQFDAPHSGTIGEAKGMLVKWQDDEYLAVVVNFSNWNRAILYIYTIDGTLEYQEILDESAVSMAAFPIGSLGIETLLIGGKNKVWQFSKIKKI